MLRIASSPKGRALGKLQKHCKIAMQSSVIKNVPFSTSDAGIVENGTFYFQRLLTASSMAARKIVP